MPCMARGIPSFSSAGCAPRPTSSSRHTRPGPFVVIILLRKRGGIVLKNLVLVATCVACLGGTAMAQDAKAVIASAQKALGDVRAITYSGSAKDVSFQQC